MPRPPVSGLSGNVELESVDESTLQKDWFASRLKPRQCQNKLDIRAVKFLSLFFFSFGVFPFPLMDFFFFFFCHQLCSLHMLVERFTLEVCWLLHFLWESLRSHFAFFCFSALLFCLFFFCWSTFPQFVCVWSIKAAKAFSGCFFPLLL